MNINAILRQAETLTLDATEEYCLLSNVAQSKAAAIMSRNENDGRLRFAYRDGNLYVRTVPATHEYIRKVLSDELLVGLVNGMKGARVSCNVGPMILDTDFFFRPAGRSTNGPFNTKFKRNHKLYKRGIYALGFDPRSGAGGEPNFSYSVKLHPHTLRPLSTVDGEPWQVAARTAICANTPFVSVYAHLCNFVLKFERRPTLNELVLYTYKCEVNKSVKIRFLNKFEADEFYAKKTVQPPAAITLPVFFDKKAQRALDNFLDTARKYTDQELMKIVKSSQALQMRKKLESMSSDEFENWLNDEPCKE